MVGGSGPVHNLIPRFGVVLETIGKIFLTSVDEQKGDSGVLISRTKRVS